MSHLTVFMPSNRDFKSSFGAIETALTYCETRGATLVVADNSSDPLKWDYWHKKSVSMNMIGTSGFDGKANFLAAMNAVETEFLLAMGDDDELLFDPSKPGPDLGLLPGDHIGVRPKTDVWTQNYGLIRTKTFAISGATPTERMLEYNQNAGGDNGAYYSIFRTDLYRHLMNFFFQHHPTSGGYGDWALVMSLFAWGKLVYDPGTIFRYNFDQWYGAHALEKRADDLYQMAGLPEGSRQYHYLLMSLDIFVYCSLGFAPLSPEDCFNAQSMAAGPFLDAFLKAVGEAPERFPTGIHELCYRAADQTLTLDRFLTSLDMVELVQPGLKERYIRFFNVAMGDAGFSSPI